MGTTPLSMKATRWLQSMLCLLAPRQARVQGTGARPARPSVRELRLRDDRLPADHQVLDVAMVQRLSAFLTDAEQPGAQSVGREALGSASSR